MIGDRKIMAECTRYLLKSRNTNTLADGLIKRTSSMLDEIESETAKQQRK